MTATARQWFCVRTHTHSESKALANLQRQGYRAYLPRYLKRRRHARRVETVAAPLFPSYLFVALDLSVERWRAIQSTFGVAYLITHGDAPVRVADEVIDTIRAREDASGHVTVDPPDFSPGDKVRIVDGVFADCQAIFKAATDKQRLAVLLDLLGRPVQLLVPAETVVAA